MFLRTRVFRICLAVSAVSLFFWWPLSHWLYADWYHSFLGFTPGSYSEGMVKMIGTCGIFPVMILGYLSWRPVGQTFLVYLMSFFSLLLGGTFLYLIRRGYFPRGEYVNVAVCIIASVLIPALFRYSFAGISGRGGTPDKMK